MVRHLQQVVDVRRGRGDGIAGGRGTPRLVGRGPVRVGGAANAPPTDLDPVYTDELTLGFQRQLGATMGAGVRYITKQWGDIIDDVLSLPERMPAIYRRLTT